MIKNISRIKHLSDTSKLLQLNITNALYRRKIVDLIQAHKIVNKIVNAKENTTLQTIIPLKEVRVL